MFHQTTPTPYPTEPSINMWCSHFRGQLFIQLLSFLDLFEQLDVSTGFGVYELENRRGVALTGKKYLIFQINGFLPTLINPQQKITQTSVNEVS